MPPPDEGVWRYTPSWMRMFLLVAPWFALFLILGVFVLVSGRFAVQPGVAFDLPVATPSDAQVTGLSALVLRLAPEAGQAEETYVFLDDARYTLAHPQSVNALAHALEERVPTEPSGTLLLLADADVAASDLMLLTDLARRSGVKYVQIAEKKGD